MNKLTRAVVSKPDDNNTATKVAPHLVENNLFSRQAIATRSKSIKDKTIVTSQNEVSLHIQKKTRRASYSPYGQ